MNKNELKVQLEALQDKYMQAEKMVQETDSKSLTRQLSDEMQTFYDLADNLITKYDRSIKLKLVYKYEAEYDDFIGSLSYYMLEEHKTFEEAWEICIEDVKENFYESAFDNPTDCRIEVIDE